MYPDLRLLPLRRLSAIGLALLAAVVPSVAHAAAAPPLPRSAREQLLSDCCADDPSAWLGGPLRETPLRSRWLFRPADVSTALSAIGQAGTELIARVARLDDLWILEAPADSADLVATRFGSLGQLRSDRGGSPCLVRTTALVGVRPYVWNTLGLRGDMGSAIAILDSGVDTAHDDLGDPDFDDADNPPAAPGDADDWRDAALLGYTNRLAVRVVGWHDVTDDMPAALGPYDYERHGTAMAGVVAGGGELDFTQTGVAPRARLVVVKTWNFEARWEVWASDLLLGIEWLLEHGAQYRVRACLIGATWDEDLEIAAAVQALTQAGIAVICSAGNQPQAAMGWPARLPEVITVGATDPDGRIANYSTPGDVTALTPDLVAPGGGGLDPSAAISTCDNEPNDSYRGRVGTSIAAAHVAGAVSLISEAMAESGRAWRSDAGQVAWLSALLRATAVETQLFEGSPPPGLRLDRGGHDRSEGFGLLQVDGAVDAVRRVVWPGDRASIPLESAVTGSAVWAARMPITGGEPVQLDLLVPAGADFDLYLYRELADDVVLRAVSRAPTEGASESLLLSAVQTGGYVVVVKRVSGKGTATLVTDQLTLDSALWPLQLSSTVTVAPATYDLDGDGLLEVVAPNNISIDPTGHTFYVFRADGRPFAPFPRTFFSAPDRRGVLTSPAVGDLGQGPCIVAGSEFGVVYGVGSDGVLRFQTEVVANQPTSSPALWEAADGWRVVVGVPDGLAVLDASGVERDRWVLGGGVPQPPAVGDVNGDGQEDVALVTDAAKVHVHGQDGGVLPGWPALRPAGSLLSAPVLVSDGAGGAARVALTEQRADGSSWLLLFEGGGALAPGFPVRLGEAGDVTARALAGCVPSRLARHGPTQLLAPLLHTDAAGGAGVRLEVVAMDGARTAFASMPLAGPAFSGANFQLTRSSLMTPVVVDLVAADGPEVVLPVHLAWEEDLVGVSTKRYGSVLTLVGCAEQAPDPRLALQAADGHQLAPALVRVSPVVADLDADGFADLLVSRGTRIYLQHGRQPTEPTTYWTGARGDPARRACYECRLLAPVAAPVPASPAALSLRVSPNPFNPRTRLQLLHGARGQARFTLLDARGRRVRSWVRALVDDAPLEETFDPVDARGRPLASGAYVLLAELGGQRATARLNLLR